MIFCVTQRLSGSRLKLLKLTKRNEPDEIIIFYSLTTHLNNEAVQHPHATDALQLNHCYQFESKRSHGHMTDKANAPPCYQICEKQMILLRLESNQSIIYNHVDFSLNTRVIQSFS